MAWGGELTGQVSQNAHFNVSHPFTAGPALSCAPA